MGILLNLFPDATQSLTQQGSHPNPVQGSGPEPIPDLVRDQGRAVFTERLGHGPIKTGIPGHPKGCLLIAP